MIKKKNIDYREIYILFLVLSAFISISLFEITVVIGLLIVLYDLFKRNIKTGALTKPLIIYSTTALFSTAIFNSKLINKGIEQGLFQLIYFFNVKDLKTTKIALKINYLFIAISIILIPVIIYKYQKTGLLAPIWGGVFEVGQFYSMFAIISFLLALYFFKKENKLVAFLFILLTVLFIGIVFFNHKRTPILGLFIVFYLLIIVLFRNEIINKLLFWVINLFLILSFAGGYWYLSRTDNRFKYLNDILTGKRSFENEYTLQVISSARYGIMKDAIHIIKTDIENKNFVNLLIGHGINSGSYLPHKYTPKGFGKYESIFLLSEFIEIGLIGVLAELFLIFIAFKKFLQIRITNKKDLYVVSLFIPLLIHLVGIAFTFFWDALLPLYLLLYRIGEEHFYRF